MNFKAFIIISLLTLTTPAFARDNIQITGSSTVFPFTSLTAQNFSESYNASAPVLEGKGSRAGV